MLRTLSAAVDTSLTAYGVPVQENDGRSEAKYRFKKRLSQLFGRHTSIFNLRILLLEYSRQFVDCHFTLQTDDWPL